MILQCGTNDNHQEHAASDSPPGRCSADGCTGRLFAPEHLARLRADARQEYS